MTQRRYGALRFVAFALQVLAWVTLILGLLVALGIVLAGAFSLIDLPLPGQPSGTSAASLIAGVIGGVTILLVAIVHFLGFLAASQMIYLLIDMEQNTRVAADALQHLLALQFAPPAVTMPAADVAAPPLAEDPAGLPPPSSQPAEPTITTAAAPQRRP